MTNKINFGDLKKDKLESNKKNIKLPDVDKMQRGELRKVDGQSRNHNTCAKS